MYAGYQQLEDPLFVSEERCKVHESFVMECGDSSVSHDVDEVVALFGFGGGSALGNVLVGGIAFNPGGSCAVSSFGSYSTFVPVPKVSIGLEGPRPLAGQAFTYQDAVFLSNG